MTDTEQPNPLIHACHKLRELYSEKRWAVIGALWVIMLAFGYYGAHQHLAEAGMQPSFWEPLYRALQLFMLDDSMIIQPGTSVSWSLELARFCSPIVAALTGFVALMAIFREELTGWRLGRKRGHVIICGLGGLGLRLAECYLDRGEDVVVIEKDQENDYLELCREKGALVVVGDAAYPRILAKARLDRARIVIAVSGDDGTNAEIAVRCWEHASAGERTPLECHAHIVDPELCQLLEERETMRASRDWFVLNFFSIHRTAARVILDDHPPFAWEGKRRPHVLVVGLGSMGRNLAARVGRIGWDRHRGAGQQLRMTVIDYRAETKIETLRLRHPRLEECCELTPLSIDVKDPEFQAARFLFHKERKNELDISSAYICLGQDSVALVAALTLARKLRGSDVPIVVRMWHKGGLTRLLRTEQGGTESGYENLHAFALLNRACIPETLLALPLEVMARVAHERYVRQQLALGETSASNPSLVPWEELPDSLKQSNLDQADSIGDRLHSIDCDITPAGDWALEPFEFTPEELEQLAEEEHERWYEERKEAGWTYAPGPKNIEAKTSPDLVPWARLSEEAREKDRGAMRALPDLLAEAGYQIYRTQGA